MRATSKRAKRNRNQRRRNEERRVCSEGVVPEIYAIGDFKWADTELQCVLEDRRQLGAVTIKGGWVFMGQGKITGLGCG